jgi:DNA-binding XRE family transcriptional regulator
MIGSVQSVELLGQRFVLVDEHEYERLRQDAAQGAKLAEQDLPPFPKPDKNGRLPALACARVALAQDLIRARKDAGLSQQQLALLAGIRQETISRLETGKHTASPRTVDKIMAAIEAQRRKRRRPSRKPRRGS